MLFRSKINFENGTEDVFATPQETEQQNGASYQPVADVSASSAFTPIASVKLAELDSSHGDVYLNF